eukprot:4581046-Amphidinium_carterae.1
MAKTFFSLLSTLIKRHVWGATIHPSQLLPTSVTARTSRSLRYVYPPPPEQISVSQKKSTRSKLRVDYSLLQQSHETMLTLSHMKYAMQKETKKSPLVTKLWALQEIRQAGFNKAMVTGVCRRACSSVLGQGQENQNPPDIIPPSARSELAAAKHKHNNKTAKPTFVRSNHVLQQKMYGEYGAQLQSERSIFI